MTPIQLPLPSPIGGAAAQAAVYSGGGPSAPPNAIITDTGDFVMLDDLTTYVTTD